LRCSTRSGETFGPDYNDHGVLFCWPDGRQPHPGHSTRRNRHADLGITGIRLRIFPDYRGPYAGSYRLSGVASWVLPPGVVPIGVSALILAL